MVQNERRLQEKNVEDEGRHQDSEHLTLLEQIMGERDITTIPDDVSDESSDEGEMRIYSRNSNIESKI